MTGSQSLGLGKDFNHFPLELDLWPLRSLLHFGRCVKPMLKPMVREAHLSPVRHYVRRRCLQQRPSRPRAAPARPSRAKPRRPALALRANPPPESPKDVSFNVVTFQRATGPTFQRRPHQRCLSRELSPCGISCVIICVPEDAIKLCLLLSLRRCVTPGAVEACHL